jgi:hypothetical protein
MRLALAVLMSTAAIAGAAPGARITVPVAPQPAGQISRVLYLERCIGGCRVTSNGVNDARAMASSIPPPGIYTVTEFANTDRQTGAAANAEWAAIVQCMREVYSPFAVEVTDVKPTTGTYHVAVVAGNPPDVGFDFSVLGVAQLSGNCAPLDNVISFSFANAHMQTEVDNRVLNICWTAAQESAHAFGLDHQFEFVSGRSACNDPMTYRFDCGGQKFFRNAQARCGREAVETCKCGPTQSSHKKLLSVFGPGTPITPPPSVMVTTPAAEATALPPRVIGVASSQRGIAKVWLMLNGFPFAELPGVAFGLNGQPEAAYSLPVPDSVPDSIYDVGLRAFDDLGTFTDSATVTVTKGAPCATAATCLPDQKCVEGRCLWDPPVGELGEPCTYNQFCKSFLCTGTADQQICTQTCEPEDPDACPAGLTCVSGVCFFAEGGGCCSAGHESWLHAGVLIALVGLVLGRRRK